LKRDHDGAIACFEAAIRLAPKFALAHANLGSARRRKGDVAGAIAAYREATRLDPKYAKTHNNLAWLLAAGPDGLRDGKQAVEHATRGCELTGWKDAAFLEVLATAHAEAGDFDKAVEYQKKALSFPEYGKQVGKAGQERLQLYARKKPYRDPALATVKD
jgi:tetratricopeptide (TPR) repeat protein